MAEVSIIMGIYNTNNEIMLQLAIDSILKQSYRDFEFIICDDGSTDGTYALLRKMTKDDERVKLIRNEENLGLALTLNHCLQFATGKYIARMDADDISLPNRLEEQVSFLENHPKYALTGCIAELIDERGVWGKRRLREKPQKKDFLFNSPFIHPTIMVRKEIMDRLNGYKAETKTRRAEDYDLFMRLYAEGYKGYNLQKCLFQFREDHSTYKRRAYKFRLDEAKIRYEGFTNLGLMPRGWIYVVKPLIVGLIPQRILSILRRERL